MHPIIERDMMQARVADLHRQADRDRIARAASPTGKRGPNLMHGRRPFSRARLIARLSALIPSPTR